ncbi:MAG: hypothetical protein PHY80_01810, partial [Rickettsiales bacterium]|nr:hypothetical protein [Rickettsiales bacterium]
MAKLQISIAQNRQTLVFTVGRNFHDPDQINIAGGAPVRASNIVVIANDAVNHLGAIFDALVNNVDFGGGAALVNGADIGGGVQRTRGILRDGGANGYGLNLGVDITAFLSQETLNWMADLIARSQNQLAAVQIAQNFGSLFNRARIRDNFTALTHGADAAKLVALAAHAAEIQAALAANPAEVAEVIRQLNLP